LCSRNFLLLGAILIGFRFLILEPTFLIPNYLQALHGYRPEQTAAVLTWVALPELLFAPLAGLLLYKVDSRLICAIGFALVGFSSFCCAGLDPNWTGETFLFNQVLTAAGLALGLAGIVASLLRSAMAAGALKAPMNLLTISCWFQTCRLFGAEVGKTGMAHFLKAQGDLHYNVLSAHINGDWLTAERLSTFAATASNASGSIDAASLAAASTIGANLKQQVALLAFADGFVLIALTAATCVMAIGCLTYCPPLISPRSK
jgi:DHA2 family multidrug resistance protein